MCVKHSWNYPYFIHKINVSGEKEKLTSGIAFDMLIY